MDMISVRKKKGLELWDNLIASFLLWQYGLLNSIIGLIAKIFFKPGLPNDPKRILILRQGGLGDTVSSLPAFMAIRDKFPQAIIDILTHHRTAGTTIIEELLPANIYHKVYRYTRFPDKDIIKQLRKNEYDLYLELPSYISSFSFELRSVYQAAAINARYGRGWNISSNTFLKKHQERSLLFERDSDRVMSLLVANGIIEEHEQEKYIRLSQEYLATAAKSPVNIDQRTVALMAGAGRPQNKWPMENFSAVARHLVGKGYHIVFLGNEKDRQEADEFMKGIAHTNLCGQLSPLESAAVLKLCKFAICNDTGPMHLAYNVGTPVIAIFSARDYANKWFPPGKENMILRNTAVACAVCQSNTCKKNVCMETIGPEEVIRAVERIVERD